MKRNRLFLIAACLISTQLYAKEMNQKKFQMDHINAAAIYVPLGYDANDKIEIVVEAMLPNLCFEAPETKVKVEGDKIAIDLKAKHFIPRNIYMNCAEMNVLIPQTVDVGTLSQGDYKISLNESQKRLPNENIMQDSLHVDETKSDGIDNNLYANVEYIDKIPGSRTVYLKGNNPSPCYELDTIEYFNNGNNTYSVLPILKQVSEVCPQVVEPFSYEFTVPEDLKTDRVMIHVRAWGGESVYTIFNNLLHL
ncbi:MAG: hypothetical protein H6622_00205 [Halobacteriovoraceae bacterium]|nr:hypothetical protein [Halobacteriovoraceae bacterium]